MADFSTAVLTLGIDGRYRLPHRLPRNPQIPGNPPDPLALDEMFPAYPPDRLHRHHPRLCHLRCNRRQHDGISRVVNFWTPIRPQAGQLFHADLQPAVLERGRASQDYPTSVAKTWQISIAAAESECAAARPLLELLAFFAPDVLPIEVLASAPATLPEGLGDELERDEAIAALHRFSLLRAEAGTLTVHRLVQAVTRDGLDAATAKAHAGAALRLVNAMLPNPQEHTNWPAIEVFLPHALATVDTAEHLKVGLETVGAVLNETALYHHARAAYAEAEPLLKRALKIVETVLGPEHRNVATSLNNLALLYHAQGAYAEAEPLYQRALKIVETVLGPEHPERGPKPQQPSRALP